MIQRYAYSLKPNPWEWLTSKEKAEAMAVKVDNFQGNFLYYAMNYKSITDVF